MEPLPKLPGTTDNPTPTKDDVMIPPTDDLSLVNALPSQPNPEPLKEIEKPTFEPPASWGGPTISSVPTPTVIPDSPLPTFSAPITNNQEPITPQKSSILKIFLTGFALILVGILIGVFAAKLVPAPVTTTATPNQETKLSMEDTEEITPEVTPELLPALTATPEAMTKLNWKNYSTESYKLYYPSTWVMKYTPEKLTLTKGKNIISITNPEMPLPESCEASSIHKLTKNDSLWDIQEATPSAKYLVCEAGEPNTSIGGITLTGTNIDTDTLDEFKLLLEKLEIDMPSDMISEESV